METEVIVLLETEVIVGVMYSICIAAAAIIIAKFIRLKEVKVNC